MRARFREVIRVEIAGADEEHVRIVPRAWVGVERSMHGTVVIHQQSTPGRRDIVAGARDVADILAPMRAHSPRPRCKANRGSRRRACCARSPRRPRRNSFCTAATSVREMAPRSMIGVSARAWPAFTFARIRAEIAQAAAIDLDVVEAPFTEIELDILLDVIVQPDLALCNAAFGQVFVRGAPRLRAGVAAHVRIDAGLEAHGMQLVGVAA